MNDKKTEMGLEELRAKLAAMRHETAETERSAEAIGASLENIQESLQARHQRLGTPPAPLAAD